jgi:Spore coat polysaccharide biosynthesis protein, predicted glycosyltransferase
LTPIPVYLDDNVCLDYPSGIILNGAINAESLLYNKRNDQTYLLGTKYLPIRKEFWDAIERPSKFDIQNVLITFGGTDLNNLTVRILRLLSRNHPNFKKELL